MKKVRSNDSNFILRALFAHCFMHIYQIITTTDPTHLFRSPRFNLFQKIKTKYIKQSNHLFRNILLTFKWHILIGAIMTCIFVFFNLLMPELIRMFMHFMHAHHAQKSQVKEASFFIRNLIGVQILRIMFGQHTRRIFYQLAIKIQSSLAKMLVTKSLNLSPKVKKDIPYSELLQLQNVDLKLTFTMFNNMMYIFQAPLTIFVALIMLFVQNKTYGFIGVYWFLIAFLLHRQLDKKMTHCNATKLDLIDKRSKINYEMLFGMREARMIGWEDVMIQKNNDLFQVQNHDHHLFYFYSSLYDIILLLLPILVIVTISIWDLGEQNHITVEQVYLMLSLLGICYEPMKQFRTISISFHDGLHSLNRISQFLEMPEQQIEKDFVSDNIGIGYLVIQKETASAYPGTVFDFFVKTLFQIQINSGQRFVILGRKGQGRTAFLNMINGNMRKITGSIKINGKKACLFQNFFFMKATVRQNIIFYNQNASQQQIEQICESLDITQQLKKTGGLQTYINDYNKFSKSLLQRISLARVLCSQADIYILDRPFDLIQQKFQIKIQIMLRKKQQNSKVTIIMASGDLFYEKQQDKIAIIQNGTIKQYAIYKQLISNGESKIINFTRSKEHRQFLISPNKKMMSPIKKKFQSAVRKVSCLLSSMHKNVQDTKQITSNHLEKKLLQPKFQRNNIYLSSIISTKTFSQLHNQMSKPRNNFQLLKKFIFSVPIIEILFILLIIACAEFMHVFIHFFIGHLEQDHGQSNYSKFKKMMIIQVILTIGLSGVLYYQGQVSSLIAISQGNKIYKSSLYSLINKQISYFISQYPVKIADRLNHDYQQVFIAFHGLLTIYKNFIILIVTVIFISSDGFTVLLFFTIIIFLYTAIYIIFRKVQKKVTAHFYDYKYGFVKCFQQSLEGAEYFEAYNIKQNMIKRAQKKYTKLASYKIAQKNTNHGLTIACDLMGNLLLASIVYFGLQAKIHHTRTNIALIATSIHLLLNGSQVLKNILKQTINFQTFFKINLVPFLQIIEQIDKHYLNIKNCQRPCGYQIRFDSAVLYQPGQIKPKPLNLVIKEREHVLIYETNQSFRNLLLYSLTKNLATHRNLKQSVGEKGSIDIGLAGIHRIHPDQLFKMVGVIMNKNFYFTGTLRDNLARKIILDQEQIDQYIKLLKIDEDIQNYDIHGLDSQIHYQNSKVNYQLTKKLAIIRILLNKCKIVILKDTSAFVGSISIVDILKKYIPECTIIKISNKIQLAIGVDRLIYMENSVIIQQGAPQKLIKNPSSIAGNMLKEVNMEDFLFKNQCSRARFNYKLKSSPSKKVAS